MSDLVDDYNATPNGSVNEQVSRLVEDILQESAAREEERRAHQRQMRGGSGSSLLCNEGRQL